MHIDFDVVTGPTPPPCLPAAPNPPQRPERPDPAADAKPETQAEKRRP